MDLPIPTHDQADEMFAIRRCIRPGCGLRFSMAQNDPRGIRCPACRALTESVGVVYPRMVIGPQPAAPGALVLDILLDNIRSAWNVGSMLRAADGAGVRQVHLCGVSASPDNPKVAKTALGAERSLPWQHHPDGEKAARQMKEKGMRVWALEGGPRAQNLFSIPDEISGAPLVLVVGNELAGVDPGILDLCDRVVCLPMQGVKGSLNVAVAFGIAVYYLRFGFLAAE